MVAPVIAVVDDDPIFLRVMVELLTLEGYHVVTSQGSDEALALVERTRPDLLLLDLRLDRPRAGLSVLARLRASSATMQLPVIVCSAASDCLRAAAGQLDQPQTLVMPKPFDLEDLLRRVRDLLAQAGADLLDDPASHPAGEELRDGPLSHPPVYG